MIKVEFKVSARAGKLLGRENFSNPEGAIIELVKNSYDADAKNCIVIFDVKYKVVKNEKGEDETVIARENSQIFIIDNGEGMTDTVIRDHWMKIGTGNKDTSFISEDKRIKTGAKGIGRFALDRLGEISEMWTLSKNGKNEKGQYWKMDWRQFDNTDQSISDITADLSDEKIDLKTKITNHFDQNSKVFELLEDLDLSHGTILKIDRLKDDWHNEEIAEVFKNLEALIPPKELNIPFEVSLLHIQEPKEYGKVETAFFNDFDYRLRAKYNAENLSIEFELTRNELELEIVKKKYANLFKSAKSPYDLDTLEKKTFRYSKSIEKVLKWDLNDQTTRLLKEVGSFDITFYYLKFTVSKKEDYPFKPINVKERKSVLDRFGGVKIYRDSFRVRPYGEPNNDWLKLGARVAASPAGAGQRIGDWRVRPEQTAGIITISRRTNPLLVDKSDRGALQENNAFETFRTMLIQVIHEFEFDRSKILNVFYKNAQKEKEEQREKEIQQRAVELADKIIAERKIAEEKIYGKTLNRDLFQDKKEAEEKKAYEEVIKDTLKAIEDDVIEKETEEIVQVRALASLGLVVSSFAHELKEVRHNATEIKSLEEIYLELVDKQKIGTQEYLDGIDILTLLKENNEKIKHWVDYSLSAIKKDKRKRATLDFSTYFKSLTKSWTKIFKQKDIKLTIDDHTKDIQYEFRAFEMDMSTIFTNLINNSIDSFNNLKEIQERHINIVADISDKNIILIYSDNGVGLSKVFEDNKEDIFLPFTTSKVDRKGKEIGVGLGMYLLKNVVNDNNGQIEILEPDKGFSVKISFPLRNNNP